MDITFTLWAGGFIIAFLIGILMGIFGVGGGFLMTPALMIILGVPGPIAVGTDLSSILVNSSLALFGRKNTGTVDVRLSLPIAAGSMIGVLLGVSLLVYLKHMTPLIINGREIVAVRYVLLCAFILVLTGIAVFMRYDHWRAGGEAPATRVGLLTKIKLPPYGCFKSLENPEISLAALALTGIVVGFATGLMGIGGGVIYLPALVFLVGQRTVKAAGTSLLLVWISSLVGVALNCQAGNIDFLLLSSLIAGGLSGTFLGTKIGLKMTGPKIRQYFVYVLLAAIVLVVYEVLRLTFGPVQ
ncbi:MAG: sulfite exporter TauE/SafE family protein [Deltaproteobacteria bacterium]|nr:sulfite exporter TauE/SafE family protein [Deltaproteobacteria bacterium]